MLQERPAACRLKLYLAWGCQLPRRPPCTVAATPRPCRGMSLETMDTSHRWPAGTVRRRGPVGGGTAGWGGILVGRPRSWIAVRAAFLQCGPKRNSPRCCSQLAAAAQAGPEFLESPSGAPTAAWYSSFCRCLSARCGCRIGGCRRVGDTTPSHPSSCAPHRWGHQHAKGHHTCLPCAADASDLKPGVRPSCQDVTMQCADAWHSQSSSFPISRCMASPHVCSLPNLRLMGAYSGCPHACSPPDVRLPIVPPCSACW